MVEETDDFPRAIGVTSAGETRRFLEVYGNPRSNIDSLCRESTEWMIHEDLSSGRKKEAEQKSGRAGPCLL